MKKRVLIAMSGGVDSSVAAALLLEQGHEVIGVTMQLWDYSKNESSCDPNAKFDTCCSMDDVADARSVAHKLGIPFYVLDYQADFQENVVDYFTDEYLKGRTPNPCVACNTFLKFDHLMERARRLNCDYVATGHYAQIEWDEALAAFKLLKGVDPAKDQSYFLYSLTQERMSKILFPLGHLTKPEVRKLADKYGLINAGKKESMEICFIPNNDYAKFIETNADQKKIIKGKVLHEDGTYITEHDGIHKFTVGQRKGTGVSTGVPVYVTRIEPTTGNVYVGSEKDLLRTGFSVRNFHLTRPINFDDNFEVKIRYRSGASKARITALNADAHAEVTFSDPQKAVTPGQIAVLYSGNEVVGGGFIEMAFQ